MDAETRTLLEASAESSTWTNRATHFSALCVFLDEKKASFPLAPATLVSFVGYLYNCLLRRLGPQLAAVSLPQYLSTARTICTILGGGELPTPSEYLPLEAVCLSYGKMPECGSSRPVRIGIPARVRYDILEWGRREEAARGEILDAALISFAAVFGLRAKGAEQVRREHVWLDGDAEMRVLVGSLKGRTTEAPMWRGARLFVSPPASIELPMTVLALIGRWKARRGDHDGYFF